MLNISQQQAMVSKLTDQQLGQELQQPSGVAPGYLVMAEMSKRQNMRNPMPQGGGQPMPSVKDQMIKGMPQAFADGGSVAGIPAGSAPFGGYTGQEAFNIWPLIQQQYMQSTGAKPAGDIASYMSQLQSQTPDPSAAYDQPLGDLAGELADEKSSAKKDMLLRMAIAMMSGKGGNLLGGLALGAQAGLEGADKSKAAQRAIQSQIMNAHIAQAQAKSGNAMKLLEMAGGQRQADQHTYDTQSNIASDVSKQFFGNSQSNAEMGMRKAIADAGDRAQLQAAGMSAGASRYNADKDYAASIYSTDKAAEGRGTKADQDFRYMYDTTLNALMKSGSGNPTLYNMKPEQIAAMALKMTQDAMDARNGKTPASSTTTGPTKPPGNFQVLRVR